MSLKRFFKAFFIVAFIVGLGFYIQIDYYLMRPSRAVDLSGMITVENADPGDRGKFFLVTVNQQRAALLPALYGYFHPQMELRPMRQVLPRDMEEQEYRQLLREYMAESRYMAQVVALRRVDYEVEIVSDGVNVVGFTDDAPAEEYLREEDKITSVDGQQVFLASELPLLVQDREVGDEVVLTIVRDEEEMVVSVPTGLHPDEEDMPYLGIYIQTLPWEPVLPLEIIMDTGNIGGPSAGLMFVLEIMNQLLPEDLTHGKLIAGSGTIDYNENVGRIGGVAQKIYTAEAAGADYFLAAPGNYEDALAAASKIHVVSVANLEEALDFLASLSE